MSRKQVRQRDVPGWTMPPVPPPAAAAPGPRTPWPAGLDVRSVRWDPGPDGAVDPGDGDAVVALTTACDVAVAGEPDSGEDDIRASLSSPRVDRDATVLVHDGPDLVAHVFVERDGDSSETWVDVYVDPVRDWPALVDAAFQHGLAAAERHRREATADGWIVRTGCFDTDDVLVTAAQRAGFARARRFWRMRVDLADPVVPAEAPSLPPGVTVIVARTEAERRRCHALRDAAFDSTWHNIPRSFEDWMAANDPATTDADGWWLLQVDGVDAALCLLDDTRLDLGDGYVRLLGVHPDHRGRGLGRLLLQRAFVRYRELGRGGVQLSVDTRNATGATALYESVGMRPVRVIGAWSRALP